MTELRVKDQLGRVLMFSKHPQRIVSLVPSVTELICDLGLASRLVGVTKFCVHPNNIRQRAMVVGGTKQVHFHKVESLCPDIILCNKEENSRQIVEQLEKIAPVHVSDISTVDQSLELIKEFGRIFGCEQQAESITARIHSGQKALKDFLKDKSQIRVAYFIWKDPWMVAASNTFIDHLLRENKFVNVYSGLERYPQVDPAELNSLSPDLIFLSSEPFPFNQEQASEFTRRGVTAKVVHVDGEYFSWFGSRLDKAYTYFIALREQLDRLHE